MDDFKKHMFHDLGIGGFNCYCCNGLTRKRHGKKDPNFHRAARSRMKVDERNEIKRGVRDYDTRYDEEWVFDEETQEWYLL